MGAKGAPRLPDRSRNCSAVSGSNTPSGSVVSSLLDRNRTASEVSPSNTSSGSVVSLLLDSFNCVSSVSPAKSPAARAVMFWLDRSSLPVMAASWAAVTAAQSLTPGIRATSASLTSCVRPQMPVSLSFTVTVTSPIVMPL